MTLEYYKGKPNCSYHEQEEKLCQQQETSKNWTQDEQLSGLSDGVERKQTGEREKAGSRGERRKRDQELSRLVVITIVIMPTLKT